MVDAGVPRRSKLEAWASKVGVWEGAQGTTVCCCTCCFEVYAGYREPCLPGQVAKADPVCCPPHLEVTFLTSVDPNLHKWHLSTS